MPVELSWASFRESYLNPGIPALYAVPGGSTARLFVDAGAHRIGLWIKVDSLGDHYPKSGRALTIRLVQIQHEHALEVATNATSCFAPFFVLASEIVDRLEAGAQPYVAAREAILGWRELLKENARLSGNDEVGLWGELWFLNWLLDHGFTDGLDAWTGPLGDPHDYRFRSMELEIKTSTGTRRHHMISSLEQLTPSLHSTLAVVSILVAPTTTESGLSLDGLAEEVSRKLADREQARFKELLASRGLDRDLADDDAKHFCLRSAPRFVPVSGDCPVLGHDQLRVACGATRAARVLKVQYLVDLESLGDDLEALPFASKASRNPEQQS